MLNFGGVVFFHQNFGQHFFDSSGICCAGPGSHPHSVTLRVRSLTITIGSMVTSMDGGYFLWQKVGKYQAGG